MGWKGLGERSVMRERMRALAETAMEERGEAFGNENEKCV